jgi:hypothetical protein
MPQAAHMDAIALLKADHRKVEDLFERFAKADDARKGELAAQICTELKIHMMIEEDDYNEAFVEHDAAKVLINDIEKLGAGDKFFESKVHVLCEEVTHHVKEEEEPGKGIFWQARQSGTNLVALRDRLVARRDELLAQHDRAGLPPAELRAVEA